MTLKELEARVQRTEDIEAIKKLQRAYSYYLEHWQEEEIIGLFSQSPDASVEIGDSGLYKGIEGVRKFFSYRDHFVAKTTKAPPEFLHLLMPLSGIVDVDPDGKTAKGGGMVWVILPYLGMEKSELNFQAEYGRTNM